MQISITIQLLLVLQTPAAATKDGDLWPGQRAGHWCLKNMSHQKGPGCVPYPAASPDPGREVAAMPLVKEGE